MELNSKEFLEFLENNNTITSHDNDDHTSIINDAIKEIFENTAKETAQPIGSDSLFLRAKTRHLKEDYLLNNSDIHHSHYIQEKRRKEDYDHVDLSDTLENIIAFLDLSLGEKIERNVLTPKTLRLFLKVMSQSKNGFKDLCHKLMSQAKNHEDAEKIKLFLKALKHKFRDQYKEEFTKIKSLKQETIELFEKRFLKHDKSIENEKENYNEKVKLLDEFCNACLQARGFDLNKNEKHNIGTIFKVLKSLDTPFLHLLSDEKLLSKKEFENLRNTETSSKTKITRNEELAKKIGNEKCLEFCKFVFERLKYIGSPKKQMNEFFDSSIHSWLSDNEQLLKGFEIIAEIISTETFNSITDLVSEHKKHTFKRFENYFSILSLFVNNILSLSSNIKDISDTEKLFNIVIKTLENTSYDHTLPISTNSQFYRDVQGKSTAEEAHMERKKSEELCHLLGYSFNKGWVRNNFFKIEDSHTYPFPGVFSWNSKKLIDLFYDNWNVIPDFSKFEVDKTLFFQNDLPVITEKSIGEKIKTMENLLKEEQDENIKQRIKTQCFFELLTCVTHLSLLQVSETEKLPHFINAELDGISEAKINEKTNQRAGAKKEYKQLISSSLVEILRVLKTEFLESGTASFVSSNTLVDANKLYINKSFSTVIERINAIIMKMDKSLVKPENIYIQKILELRMLCNVYASLLPIVEKFKEEENLKDSSMTVKNLKLNENKVQGLAEGLLWAV